MSPPQNDAAPRREGGGHDTQSQPPPYSDAVTRRSRPPRSADRPDCGACHDAGVDELGRPCRCVAITALVELDLAVDALPTLDELARRLSRLVHWQPELWARYYGERLDQAERSAWAAAEALQLASDLADRLGAIHHYATVVLTGERLAAAGAEPMGVAA